VIKDVAPSATATSEQQDGDSLPAASPEPVHAAEDTLNCFDLIALGNTTRVIDRRSAKYLAMALCKLTSHADFKFEHHVSLHLPAELAGAKKSTAVAVPGGAHDFNEAAPVLLRGLLRLVQSPEADTHRFSFVALVNFVLKVSII